ncbi:transcription factor bHLH128-like [Musa acuminata AAA Group]|uniref:transcription factor bHLH128-like n=1 Tax=Musa acuminata AAA Group TaxID=214697 RepID=UPI0031D970F8
MNRSPTDGNELEASGLGLSRYGSDPGSLLAGVASEGGGISRFAPAGEDSSSSCRGSDRGPRGPYEPDEVHAAVDLAAKVGGGPALVRHSSSPAGFFSRLLMDHGLSSPSGIGSYSRTGNGGAHTVASRRLTSQWSFSRKDTLSHISEMSIPEIGEDVDCDSSSDEATAHVEQSFISGNFQLSSWDDSNSIMFSAPHKRTKGNNGDILTSLSNTDSQFNLSKNSLEVSSIEKYLQLQQDSVPCRVRAKRGCATHPRSIAERERRTRISKRLQKLHNLVPNMDKQTSTSDMLELAIQYIKELQSQVQKLKQEQEDCICTSRQEKA